MKKIPLIITSIGILIYTSVVLVRAKQDASNDQYAGKDRSTEEDKSRLPWMADGTPGDGEEGSKNRGSESPVEKNLQEAFKAIHKGRYDVAISKCEKALLIEPNNATALGRMGTAYYLLKDNDQAANLWKQALKLEPDNQLAIKFLNKLKNKRSHSLSDLH